MENASRQYTAGKVKNMIERQKKRYGWEFLFIGANIDAVQTAGNYGISPECAVNYHADETGTRLLYGELSTPISAMRGAGAIPDDWRNGLDKDFKERR